MLAPVNNVKYFNEDFVYIANDATIERQKSTKEPERQGLLQSTDYWVAKILEVRALDEHHVYARVYWMYSPDELPANTLDGKRVVSGRQPYHGQNELIASNHSESPALARRPPADALQWMSSTWSASPCAPSSINGWNPTTSRCRTPCTGGRLLTVEPRSSRYAHLVPGRLGCTQLTRLAQSVELTCKCKTPANPDKTLVGCTKSGCEQWLHYECLEHDVLMRTFERLGKGKPHKSAELDGSAAKAARDDKLPAALRSTTPNNVKGEEPTQSAAIGVKAGENGDSVPMKQIDGITPKTTESPMPGMPMPAAEKLPRMSSGKKGRPRKVESRPYEGLFEASLKLDDGPTMWRITDLRAKVSGGDRTWTERAQCLVCGTKID